MEKHTLSFTAPVRVIEFDPEYLECIADIIERPEVLEMENFSQHSNSNRLEHSLYVSYNSYLICRKLGLDARSAARGGLLHDFFLYDRRDVSAPKGFHGIVHPRSALRNALEIFELNNVEKDIIKRHMFPLTITPPRYKESYVIMCVDKYCACLEALDLMKRFRALNLWKYLPA